VGGEVAETLALGMGPLGGGEGEGSGEADTEALVLSLRVGPSWVGVGLPVALPAGGPGVPVALSGEAVCSGELVGRGVAEVAGVALRQREAEPVAPGALRLGRAEAVAPALGVTALGEGERVPAERLRPGAPALGVREGVREREALVLACAEALGESVSLGEALGERLYEGEREAEGLRVPHAALSVAAAEGVGVVQGEALALSEGVAEPLPPPPPLALAHLEARAEAVALALAVPACPVGVGVEEVLRGALGLTARLLLWVAVTLALALEEPGPPPPPPLGLGVDVTEAVPVPGRCCSAPPPGVPVCVALIESVRVAAAGLRVDCGAEALPLRVGVRVAVELRVVVRVAVVVLEEVPVLL